jgi:hypothetical protein
MLNRIATAVSFAAVCRAQCNDGSCPDADSEVDSMKVSLLQSRRNMLDAVDAETARLLKQKEVILKELASLDSILKAEDEPDVWVATAPGEDLSDTDVLAAPASGGADFTDESLLQLRGAGSCQSFGCGYQHGRTCQCNKDCKNYNSCCDDYEDVCKAGSCAKYTCAGAFVPGRDCQCNDKCKHFNSCCSDFDSVCKATPDSTPAPTEAQPENLPEPVEPDESEPEDSANEGSAVEGVFGHPDPSIDYPKYEGFTLWLAEEFNEAIDIDKDKFWTWSDGGLREGEVRFVKRGLQFRDGKMIIEVSNEKPFPQTESCSHASVEHIGYKPLTSGELRSRHNMFRYGRYEVRMKAPEVQKGNPNVNGNFISTMFVYRDANAHHWREIDFEITADGPNSLTTNQLYADGTKNWKPYLQDSRKPYIGNINVRSDFHTYMFEWTPSGVVWFVDGKEVRRGSKLKTPEMSTKIMMNLWIFTGGHFGGNQIYNNRYPFHAEYEYFRFYKWDKDDKSPCADGGTSCLTEDDSYLSGNNPCDGIEMKGLLEGQKPCHAVCRER